jgi:hypothetical protein
LKLFFYRRFIDDAIVIKLNSTPEKHKPFMDAMNTFTNGNNKTTTMDFNPTLRFNYFS